MKRAFPHNKNNKSHGKKGWKKYHEDRSAANSGSPASVEHRSGDGEDSDSDLEKVDTEGLTGVIDKLGELNRGRPAGLVTFTLKNGESAIGKFSEEQTIANGFRLKDMRAYTSNPSLTFPFCKGMPFKIYGLKQMPKHVKGFSYVVHIKIGGSDGPESPIVLEDLAGKDIASYDGALVTGKVKAFKSHSGVATFVKDGSEPLLTHFTVQSINLNGLAVSRSSYADMIYVGMAIPMQITSSASTKIPGIYYTADIALDIPAACGVEEALQEPEEFRGVVLKTENKTPVLLALFCKGNEDPSRKFYVACENVTANNEPLEDVGLDFSERTSVLCSLRFKHKYPKIEEGCVYLANADMPIKMCEIKKLTKIRGMSFPQLLVTAIDGGNKDIFVNRRGIKVNGSMPSGFPEQFFKVNMVIPVNDIRVMNNNYRAALNVSRDIVNKSLKIEESTSSAGDSTKKAAGGKRPRKPMPVQGLISGLRENAEGRVLPSEVSAIIEEKEQKINIPTSQVFVNGKNEMYLPTSIVNIGSRIKVHNLKFSEDSKRYEGTLVYDFPKSFMFELFGTNQKRA